MTQPPTTHPRALFALAGPWVRLLLDDHGRPASDDPASDDSPSHAAWDRLRPEATVGADVAFVKVGGDDPVVAVVSWPPGEDTGDATPPAVRRRAGVEGDVLPHAAGYTVVRSGAADPGSGPSTVTYAVAHPTTGRILLLTVVAAGSGLTELDRKGLDLSVSRLTWKDTDG